MLLTNKSFFNMWKVSDKMADSASTALKNRNKQPAQKVPMVDSFTLPSRNEEGTCFPYPNWCSWKQYLQNLHIEGA